MVEHQPAIVLYVDDERVHLGALRDVDELPHAVADCRPPVDVESANGIGRRHERHRWAANRIRNDDTVSLGNDAVGMRSRALGRRRTLRVRADVRARARAGQQGNTDERTLKYS